MKNSTQVSIYRNNKVDSFYPLWVKCLRTLQRVYNRVDDLSSKRYCHYDNVLHTILIKVKIVVNNYHGNRVGYITYMNLYTIKYNTHLLLCFNKIFLMQIWYKINKLKTNIHKLDLLYFLNKFINKNNLQQRRKSWCPIIVYTHPSVYLMTETSLRQHNESKLSIQKTLRNSNSPLINSEAPIKSLSSAILNKVVSIAECFKLSRVIGGAREWGAATKRRTNYCCFKIRFLSPMQLLSSLMLQIFRVAQEQKTPKKCANKALESCGIPPRVKFEEKT